jgi:hypothetical protein
MLEISDNAFLKKSELFRKFSRKIMTRPYVVNIHSNDL